MLPDRRSLCVNATAGLASSTSSLTFSNSLVHASKSMAWWALAFLQSSTKDSSLACFSLHSHSKWIARQSRRDFRQHMHMRKLRQIFQERPLHQKRCATCCRLKMCAEIGPNSVLQKQLSDKIQACRSRCMTFHRDQIRQLCTQADMYTSRLNYSESGWRWKQPVWMTCLTTNQWWTRLDLARI